MGDKESYEASRKEEIKFRKSLREHVEKNYVNGLLLIPYPGVARTYTMIVSSISRLEVLALGKFHVTVEMIAPAAAPNKIQLTLKRMD